MVSRKAGVIDITPEGRHWIAERTAEHVEMLRRGGMGDVVPTRTIDGMPGHLESPYAGGVQFDELSEAARERAIPQMESRFRRASLMMAEYEVEHSVLPRGIVEIDPQPVNFVFDSSGNVTAWVDPVMALPLDSNIMPRGGFQ